MDNGIFFTIFGIITIIAIVDIGFSINEITIENQQETIKDQQEMLNVKQIELNEQIQLVEFLSNITDKLFFELDDNQKRCENTLDIKNNKILALSEMYNNQLNADIMILRPTYQQILSFISKDHTDIKIHKWSYDCTEFTNELIANARDKGIFACTAELTYLDGKSGHVLVAFNTIDRGIIYVEPQNDNVMTKDFGVDSVYWNNKVVKISSCWD